MELNEIKNILTNTQNGSIHTIEYKKDLKTLKSVTDKVTKHTVTQGRFGVTYDNIGIVKDARNSGDLPSTNQGLPENTEWLEYPYLIRNTKTGSIQLRVTRVKSKNSKTTYMKNGVECSKDDVQNLCLKSEFLNTANNKSKAAVKPVFNISLDKIISIK